MTRFTASFYDGQRAVAHAVEVESRSTGIEIYLLSEKQTIFWPFEHIVVMERPMDHQSGKFGHTKAPDAQLMIEDIGHFKAIQSRIPYRNKAQHWKLAAQITAVVIGLFVIVLWVIPMLALALLEHVPKSWEQKLGQMVHAQFLASEKVCHTKAAGAILEKVTKRLGEAANVDQPFTVTVLKIKETNAAALPGGYILIFDGLLEEAQSPEELAGVLAHEMGHVVMRHGTVALIRNLAAAFVVDVVTGGGGTMLYLASQLSEMRYSRAVEAEADRFALELLAQAKISPQGFLDFFTRAEKENDAFDHEMLRYFSSHPVDQSRAAMAKEYLGANKTYAPLLKKAEWQALKTICTNP